MEIEHTSSPNSQDIDFLTEKINEETPEFGASYPFAFFIRDNHGKIIAGANGSVVFGAVYTDQLWVDRDHRKAGLGRKLMEQVENYGRSVGCTTATVATMSFQGAQKFYEKLGYIVDFERKGYVNGSSCLFLRRNLSHSNQTGKSKWAISITRMYGRANGAMSKFVSNQILIIVTFSDFI